MVQQCPECNFASEYAGILLQMKMRVSTRQVRDRRHLGAHTIPVFYFRNFSAFNPTLFGTMLIWEIADASFFSSFFGMMLIWEFADASFFFWNNDDLRNCSCLSRNNLRLGCSTQTVRSDWQKVRSDGQIIGYFYIRILFKCMWHK